MGLSDDPGREPPPDSAPRLEEEDANARRGRPGVVVQHKYRDEIVELLNSVLRGWGRFFRIGDLRQIGRRLDRWVLRRLRPFMAKRWRTANWRRYPEPFFYRRLGLHSLRKVA